MTKRSRTRLFALSLALAAAGPSFATTLTLGSTEASAWNCNDPVRRPWCTKKPGPPIAPKPDVPGQVQR